MRAAVFLDRDGVINVERSDYVTRWEDFVFLPGTLDALAMLSSLDADVVVITNQSAVGRGLLSARGLAAIHDRMTASVAAAGGRIDAVYACPHTPAERCRCRKPEPGLLLKAAFDRRIDLARSIFVGDALTDVEAGTQAGCATLRVSDDTSPDLAAAIPAIARHLRTCSA